MKYLSKNTSEISWVEVGWGLLCLFLLVGVIYVCIMYLQYLQPSRWIIHKHVKDGYELWEIENILSCYECDRLIEYGNTHPMEKSRVYSKDGDTNDNLSDDRKSETIWLSDGVHVCAQKMANSARMLTGFPISHQEELQIVKYQEGGKFSQHFDPRKGTPAESRIATLLVYLNDDFKGGETTFVELDLKIKPKKGKGILFVNLDKTHQIIPLSKHCGEVVERGNKWICTKWIHYKPYGF